MASPQSLDRLSDAVAPFCVPTEIPEWQGKTNGDLIEYIGELVESIGKANADKMAIKEILGGAE